MNGKIAIRPIKQNDYSFGYYIKKVTLKEYIEKTYGWNTEFQKDSYRKTFNTENKYIIELDNKKIGWLNYVKKTDEIEIHQIFILPKDQNKGIGSKIIIDIINIGKNEHKPIKLQVLKTNIKAKKLYEKLGFIEYEQNNTHYKLKYD